jgi:polysaccharide biosynthesis protein PslG
MRRRRVAVGAVAAGAVAAAALVVVVVVLVSSGGGARQRRTGGPAPVPPQRPALPAPSAPVYGVNVNRLFNDLAYTQTEIDAQLAAVRATGATIARSDALWEATEPTAPVAGHHRYDWSFDDRIAGSLAAHGLTWLPIVDYSAPWAQSVAGQDHSPPRSDLDYAAYAAALAARYGSGGAFWRAHPALAPAPVTAIEIWNEPDNGEFWAPRPDAATYARLYLVARAAIDAAEPSVRVLVGGLTNPPVSLPAMVRGAPQLRGHVDGVAVHPYGGPQVMVARIRGARAALGALGMGSVPLYVTEFGWTTQPPGATGYTPASRRPAEITTVLRTLGHLECGLAAVLLYTWVTPEHNAADPQDWYGIANPVDPAAGTPDTAAFASGLRAAVQPAPATSCAGPT